MQALLFTLSVAVAQVIAHGVVTSPAPRILGSNALAACGTGAFNLLNGNIYAPVEEAVAVEDSGFNADECSLFFCRGATLSDNVNNTNVFAPGSVVNMSVTLKVRHTGFANVSIVDLNAQTTIGDPLFYWPVYANQSITDPSLYPVNETSFSVTIPESVPESCGTAGNCALQWWWFGSAVDQTYMSCVDFTTA